MASGSTDLDGESSNEKRFVFFLNEFIDEELSLLGENDSSPKHKERFLIFREAFAKVIAFSQVYKGVLQNIKNDYELCISELEETEMKREVELDEIKKAECYHLTIANLEKRKDELEKQISYIREQGERLNKNLETMKQKNEQFRPKTTNKFADSIEREMKRQDQDDSAVRKLIPGVSLDNATNLDFLNNLSNDIERRISELNENRSRNYVEKQQKIDLEAKLMEKIKIKEGVIEEGKKLKNNIYLFKVALNAAKEFYSTNSQNYTCIEDAMTKSVLSSSLRKQAKQNSDDDEIDAFNDAKFEKDSQFMLDYIEKFNELFGDGKYVEAAYYAAASPENLLRTMQTLSRFREISSKMNFSESHDPLLVYCIALVDSISETLNMPNEELSTECVKIALKFNKLDLLTRWVAQKNISFMLKRLTFSGDLANTILEHAGRNPKNFKNSYELALFIYRDLNASFETAICLAKLGRFTAMMELISAKKDLAGNTEVYVKILKECPSLELATLMIDIFKAKEQSLPTERMVSILLDSEQPENGLKMLEILIEKLSKDNNSEEELIKLKASYETLTKYSFLAQDDEQLANEVKHESKDKLHNIYFSTKSQQKNPHSTY